MVFKLFEQSSRWIDLSQEKKNLRFILGASWSASQHVNNDRKIAPAALDLKYEHEAKNPNQKIMIKWLREEK